MQHSTIVHRGAWRCWDSSGTVQTCGQEDNGHFCHPDDESTVAPILARYEREGAAIHLVIATDGRYGTNDYHDHTAGPSLVATRKKEMACAAKLLGAKLHHLEYHDQLKAGEGYDGHVPHARSLVLELKEIITTVQPDILITWGPDGGTTHMDHRLLGASVTQVFLSLDLPKPLALYYYGTPIAYLDTAENKTLRGQHPKFLRTKIGFDEADLMRSYTSLKCHYSQIDPKMDFASYKKRYAQKGHFVYLRKFVAPLSDEDGFFGE